MGKAGRDHDERYAGRINRVVDYIYAHLDETLDVETLSAVACFSPFHFHRQFTAATGMTVGRLIQLLRIKRASMQLVFNPARSVTDIALEAGFSSPEAFSRAFRKLQGQSPSAFRRAPEWAQWQVRDVHHLPKEYARMKVEIVDYPQTLVAALEHHGPERLSYQSSMKFIEWRKAAKLGTARGAIGIHYSDPVNTLPEDYRLDICVAVDEPVAPNDYGVVTKVIPAGRCAKARHRGSRHYVAAADYLYREWLPASGEQLRDFPMFFHYVNVGPDVKEHEMITDVYLPLL